MPNDESRCNQLKLGHPPVLRSLRQVLIKVVTRLLSRTSQVRILPGASMFFFSIICA